MKELRQHFSIKKTTVKKSAIPLKNPHNDRGIVIFNIMKGQKGDNWY